MNYQNEPFESHSHSPNPSQTSAPEAPSLANLSGRQNDNPTSEPEHPPFFLFLSGWVEAFTTSLVIVILLFTFLFRSVSVDGESMTSSLLDKDRLLVSSMFYSPSREDIVVIIPTETMPKALIKRVIALEGDTLDIIPVNGEGQVLINGKELDEPYLDADRHIRMSEGQAYHFVVPEGHVFVMGDNRNESIDSRDPRVGMVDVRLIMGKALFRIAPMNRLGLLYNNTDGGTN